MPQTRTDLDLHVGEEPPITQFSDERESDLLGRLLVLAEHKSFLLKSALVAAIASAATAFFLPPVYEANTKVMPPQQSQSIAMSMLTQLGPLAGLAGKDLGLHNPSDVYVDVLRSRTVADDLINKFSLMQVYHKRNFKDTRRHLENVTEILAAKDGVISVTVNDREPQRAADLANGYVQELQTLTQTLAVTEAGRRRLFFEHEVQKAYDELGTAEQTLKRTQQKTGVIQLDSQSKAMIEAMVGLQAQIATQEMQIQAMHTFATPENPDLIRAQQALAALRSQLDRLERGQSGGSLTNFGVEKIPEAGLEFLRALREVKYRESLLEVLTKQYEIARIDEAKDAAVIQVLDTAVRPEQDLRSWPFRVLIAMAVMILAFMGAVFWVLTAHSIDRARSDPHYAGRLERLRFYLIRRRGSGESGG